MANTSLHGWLMLDGWMVHLKRYRSWRSRVSLRDVCDSLMRVFFLEDLEACPNL